MVLFPLLIAALALRPIPFRLSSEVCITFASQKEVFYSNHDYNYSDWLDNNFHSTIHVHLIMDI